MGSARTELVARWWEGHYYPDAGEVIGWRETRRLRAGEETSYPPAMVSAREVAGSAVPPGPGERNAERAARRARSRLRRYATANKLDRLIVLTWAPVNGEQVSDLRVAKKQTANFIRHGLRTVLKYRGAYAIGWERHKSGAWHCNVLVGSWIDQEALARAWGRGYVWISQFHPRKGESKRDGARRAAGYVAKYVAKEFEALADDFPGVHRYEVGQGFAIRVVRVYALSADGIIEECEQTVGYRFYAPAPEAGRGPPIVWAAFT